MLAAVLHDFNDLRVEQADDPMIQGPDDVIVRIKSCGICATDYKAVKGIRRNVEFPFIPGHECAGVIVEVGSGVSQFQVGDEVVCQPSGFCGFCMHCRTGHTHYCQDAFTTGGDGAPFVWPGAFAELMRTRQSCLLKKPKHLSFDVAALTEPLSGAWKGVIKYSQMQVGDDVVVLGAGSMGLLCIMVARAAGAGRLIAVDPSAHARQIALKNGATHALDPRDGDLKQRAYEIMPQGPDLVVEAAGPIQAVRDMVSLLRRGTRWQLFGITTHETFELDGGLMHFLEARMDASFGTTPEAMQYSVRLMDRKLVDINAIITHHFSLRDITQAMDVMGSDAHSKIVVHP